MKVAVASLEESHFDQLLGVADRVARERRYLAILEAPPPEHAFAFYRSVIADGQCHVALIDERVVGWCDILPSFGQARRHVGTLGIGIVPEFRGRGLGAQLLVTAIDVAWARGLTRIELSVREDNLPAKALYERLGFKLEGVLKRSMLVDSKYYDCHFMALLR